MSHEQCPQGPQGRCMVSIVHWNATGGLRGVAEERCVWCGRSMGGEVTEKQTSAAPTFRDLVLRTIEDVGCTCNCDCASIHHEEQCEPCLACRLLKVVAETPDDAERLRNEVEGLQLARDEPGLAVLPSDALREMGLVGGIVELTRQWREATDECRKLRGILDADPEVIGAELDEVERTVGLKHPAIAMLAADVARVLAEHPQAPNFVALHYRCDELGLVEVVVHRPGGKSQQQLLMEAVARLAAPRSFKCPDCGSVNEVEVQ